MRPICDLRFAIVDLRVCASLSIKRSASFDLRKSAFKNLKSKIVLPLVFAATLAANASHFDGSRTTPVHRIPLTDEEGQPIISTVPNSMPMSARMTCGACHDYETIHGGSHFKGAGQGRANEPWIVVDEKNGTQVPAVRMNLSDWEFTKQFGSHLPGGGISDPEDKLADPDARWDISGGLEMNCLGCHSQSHRQDMTEWAKQVGRENFRWAATAASGIGEVGGMASRMPDWWNVYDGGSPDDHQYRVPPSVNYDQALFDSKHRIWFDIGRPQDNSCLQCHSAHPVGAQRMDIPGDVHAAAGLSCVDCHRNGEDHQMLRGTTETMSCAACHTEDGLIAGQAGAPIAHHKGIPPSHFDKMTCTACHSGQTPAEEPQLMRTSRANRLGIYGRAQWFTESPFIVEPVFVRNEEGRIEPRRMMWPAYWAYADGRPLETELIEEAAAGVLDAAELVADVLSRLAASENAPGEPLYVAGGNLYRSNVDGGLDPAGSIDSADMFVWATESNVVSTIPEFDVNAEEIDYDAEGAILAVMDALKPLEIIMISGGKQFAKDADGYLARTNSTLSAGWYTTDGQPLVSGFLERAILDTVGTSYSINEEQLALMLKKLGATACYISNGRKFTLSESGELIDEDCEFAEPVSWPIGHDVRGAGQSLGAKSCKDCHAPDSNFLFGSVTATGPLLTDRAATVSMHEFQDVEAGFNKLFGTTFLVRKQFKCFLSNAVLALILIVLAVGLPLIYRLVSWLEEKKLPRGLVLVALIGSVCVLALTGFLFGWPVSTPLGGFPLLMHVGFGALYAFLLVIWAALRAKQGNVWFWILLISGIVLILSILIAMFSILGTHGQHVAIIVHRVAAIVSIIAAAMGCVCAKKQD